MEKEYIGKAEINIYSDSYVIDKNKVFVDRLLSLLKNDNFEQIDELMGEDYFYYKNLFYIREAIVHLMDIDKSQNILEIGSGCGAITGKLCEKANKVTCIDVSKERSCVNAYRHKKFDNLCICVGNYEHVLEDIDDKFDVITLIGIMDENTEYEIKNSLEYYINIAKKKLTLKGKLYVAVDNKLGIYYLSGGKRTNDRMYFQSVNSLDDVVRYTKGELKKIVLSQGMKITKWMYPYPDYIFPIKNYTDMRLPKNDELAEEIYDIESEHLNLFNIKNMYNILINEGLYSDFVNSYLIEIKREI